MATGSSLTRRGRVGPRLATPGNHGPDPWRKGKRPLQEAQLFWAALKAAQLEDTLLGVMIRYLRREPFPDPCPSLARFLTRHASEFCLASDGTLLKYISRLDRCVICVPEKYVSDALEVVHDTPWAGHKGIKGTIRLCQKNFWWSRMSSDCADYVRKCAMCARFKANNRNPVAPMGRTDLPNEIWETLYMDHFSVGESAEGYKGVIAFIDGFSKFAVLAPVKDYSALEVVRVFMDKVATVYGLPRTLRSDNGPGFTAQFQAAIFAAAGVTREFATPYRPQAQGQVERLFGLSRGSLQFYQLITRAGGLR